MQWHSRFLCLAMLSGLAGIVGCPQPAEVWLAPGATVSNVTFLLGPVRGASAPIAIGTVSVNDCSDSSPIRVGATQWKVHAQDAPVSIASVHYGASPVGFTVDVPPAPLRAGCFVVAVTGSASVRFQVLRNGRVIDIGKPW